MRVATFNVDSLDMPPKAEVAIEDRIPILRPQLERVRADILCLQEINAQHVAGAASRRLLALEKLIEGTRYETYARAVSVAPGDAPSVSDVHNLVTLSRWPIRAFRSIRNSRVPPLGYRPVTAVGAGPQDIAFERPILVADVELPRGDLVTVVNLHLRAPLAAPVPGQKIAPFVWRSIAGWAEGYAIAAWKRTAQALEARLLIDDLMDAHPGRFILVAGDFNAEDHETPLKILVGAEEDTGNGLLAARSLVALARSLPADRRFSILYHGRPQMVDHILVNYPALAHFRALEVHNETLGDQLVCFGRVRHEAGSFHAPVIAEFDLD